MTEDASSAPTPESDGIYESLSILLENLTFRGPLGGTIDSVPPVHLEQALNGGPNPLIGRYYGALLTEDRPLPRAARILDVGCGYGRIALDLAGRLSDDQHYLGLDPNADAIAWATTHIASERPNFSFKRINVASRPYNPLGTVRGAEFRFPCDDNSLDLVFMISVMTHIDLENVETYIREAARTLKPETGRLVATFFLLDDEVDALIEEGRSQFLLEWNHGKSRVENPDNPELVIAHPRDLVLAMLRDAGFARVAVHNGNWSGRTDVKHMDYQDLVIADLSPAQTDIKAVEDELENSDLRELAEQLSGRGFRGTDVPGFLVWATALSLNALWWQSSGLSVALHDGSVAPFHLTHSQQLGFDSKIPHAAGLGHYVPVEEPEALGLIAAAGPKATRPTVAGLLREIFRNGLLADRVLRSGGSVVLSGTGEPDRIAPIAQFIHP